MGDVRGLACSSPDHPTQSTTTVESEIDGLLGHAAKGVWCFPHFSELCLRDCWARREATEKGGLTDPTKKLDEEGGLRGTVALSMTTHRALLVQTPEVVDFFAWFVVEQPRMTEVSRCRSYESGGAGVCVFICVCRLASC
jgi:hypothetical protein